MSGQRYSQFLFSVVIFVCVANMAVRVCCQSEHVGQKATPRDRRLGGIGRVVPIGSVAWRCRMSYRKLYLHYIVLNCRSHFFKSAKIHK